MKKDRIDKYLENFNIDIHNLYNKYAIDKKHERKKQKSSIYNKIYRNRYIPLSVRNKLFRIFRRANIDTSWFEDFQEYWTGIVQGRPLWDIYDFFFIKNILRIKFSELKIGEKNDPSIHEDIWQRPELLYQLFFLISKEAFHNWSNIISMLKKKLRIKDLKILEYGCGTAPISRTLFEFNPDFKRIDIWISDIQTIAFHYACFRFGMNNNVHPVLLKPESNFQLLIDEKFDVILCLAVFEHLNSPLLTIINLHKKTKKGGLLFIDYIKSEGTGLDTKAGIDERKRVLEFIETNFIIRHGKLQKEKSMGLIIAEKK